MLVEEMLTDTCSALAAIADRSGRVPVAATAAAAPEAPTAGGAGACGAAVDGAVMSSRPDTTRPARKPAARMVPTSRNRRVRFRGMSAHLDVVPRDRGFGHRDGQDAVEQV